MDKSTQQKLIDSIVDALSSGEITDETLRQAEDALAMAAVSQMVYSSRATSDRLSSESRSAPTPESATTSYSAPTPVGSDGSEEMVWIPIHGGTKYHNNSSCSKMVDPGHVSISQAKSMGFTACKRCYK